MASTSGGAQGWGLHGGRAAMTGRTDGIDALGRRARAMPARWRVKVASGRTAAMQGRGAGRSDGDDERTVAAV